AAVGHLVEPGPDADRAHARVVRALGVDLLVADQKRAGKVDIVVTRGFKNHSGRRFATFRRLAWRVRTKISGVDQIVSELARNFRLHRAILFLCEKAAPDSALIRDDDDFV